MTATYDEPTVIYGTSRVTYDGEADDTEGAGVTPRAATVAALAPSAATTDTVTPRAATVPEVKPR